MKLNFVLFYTALFSLFVGCADVNSNGNSSSGSASNMSILDSAIAGQNSGNKQIGVGTLIPYTADSGNCASLPLGTTFATTNDFPEIKVTNSDNSFNLSSSSLTNLDVTFSDSKTTVNSFSFTSNNTTYIVNLLNKCTENYWIYGINGDNAQKHYYILNFQ